MGRIHSFVLPSLLNEGENPPFTIFIRRIIHYMHNAYVVNDSSDRSHLLPFTSLDDARDLFSLVALAIFLNVFDERTYQMSSETHQNDPVALLECHKNFDLNAIPVIERHHLCYIRGLSLDLLEWFFENYSFSSIDFGEDDVDAFSVIFIPFVVRIGRQIVKYKRDAAKYQSKTCSTAKQVNHQIQSALFSFKFARDAWSEERAAEEEEDHQAEDDYQEEADVDKIVDADACDLNCDISGYSISRREVAEERNSSSSFLEDGKTDADKRFFRGLASEFNLEDLGKISLFKTLRFTIVTDVIL